MKLKPLIFYLTAILVLVFGIQQPVFGAIKGKNLCSSSTHHHKNKKQISHTVQLITFQEVSFTFPPVTSIPYISTNLSVESRGSKVSLQLQGFSFPLDVQGYIFTEAGFLKQDVAPNSALAVLLVVPVTIDDIPATIECRVFRDGSIRFSDLGQEPLNPGTYVIPTLTIKYKRQKAARSSTLDNFPIAGGLTNATVNEVGRIGADVADNLEYYGVDFVDGIVHATWNDNQPQVLAQNPYADDAQNQWTYNSLLGTKRRFKPDLNLSTFALPPPVSPVPEFAFFAEGEVAVNPTDPCFIVTVTQVTGYPTREYMARSTDGGKTWSRLFPYQSGAPLKTDCRRACGPARGGDFRLIYDKFGNLFFVYLTSCTDFSCPSNNQGADMAVALSTDNGLTWIPLSSPVPTPGGRATFGYDFPSVATGNDVDGQASVLYVGGKPVETLSELLGSGFSVPYVVNAYMFTGLGLAHYSGVQTQSIPGSERFGYGNIAVNNQTGRVVVTAQITTDSSGLTPPQLPNFGALSNGQDAVMLSQNVGGWTGKFQPFERIADTTIGQFTFPPPQPGRGTWSEPRPAYDDSGRLYVAYADQPASPNLANQAIDIWLIFSDDNGGKWSAPFKVNNTRVCKTHMMPNMRKDTSSGKIVVTWLDTRNSPDDVQTQLFGAYINHKSFRQRSRD